MSGPGDGETGGDEAAWRDLIARFDVPTDRTTTVVPWPASEDLPGPQDPAGLPDSLAETHRSPSEPAASPADAGEQSGWTPNPTAGPADPTGPSDQIAGPATSFAIPVDRSRVIRPADLPRSYTPPAEEEEPYEPVPLPPPARLDSTSKAALAGVIGGPGYLLVASIFLHWTISAEAAFIAVAAFVGGFVTLVVKLGDRSGRDDDDDGAVL